jgi:Acyl-CoA thioesterase C-terminal domain/Acyl-CoA thioesterase N-terminal domain
MSDGSLFLPDGDTWVPQAWSRGPWDPNALHGGPVAALLARGVEHVPSEGLSVARLTVELLRPVPLEPLHLAAHVVRPGRKVQLVEATLEHAATGQELARARALRIRTAGVEVPWDDPALAEHLAPEPAPPPPEGLPRQRPTFNAEQVAFATQGAEHRFVAGSWAEPGPVTVWIRLLVPVVAGEEPSGLQRVAAAADFANGIARVLPFETHLFINPDLTIHLLRPPEGEWVGMQSRTHLGDVGFGLAESALYDERGRLGRSVQSLLVDTR